MENHTHFDKKDYVTLALWFFPAAVVTWGIHESAHWGMGQLLGYDMRITFNTAGPVSGTYINTSHEILVALAGPIITWIQAIVAFSFINRIGQFKLYSFLFLPLVMRLLALTISYISNPNDEAKASILLGLPMWILPSISVGFLLVLTYKASKRLELGWKANVLAYVMSALMTTIVVFLDKLIF